MCWWKVEKKEMSFLLREVAENKNRTEDGRRDTGDRGTVLNAIYFYVSFLLSL